MNLKIFQGELAAIRSKKAKKGSLIEKIMAASARPPEAPKNAKKRPKTTKKRKATTTKKPATVASKSARSKEAPLPTAKSEPLKNENNQPATCSKAEQVRNDKK